MPSVQTLSTWVSPRWNRPVPWAVSRRWTSADRGRRSVGAATVDADALLDHPLADQLLGEGPDGLLDLLLPTLELALELLADGGGGLVGGGVALGLEGDGGRLAEGLGADRGDPLEDVRPVVDLGLEGQRVAAPGPLHQLVLQVHGLADPGLRRLQPVGDDRLGDLRRAGLVVGPGRLGAARLDHHDRDLAVDLAAGDHDQERRVIALGPRGVWDPGAIGGVREAHGADGPVEGEAGQHERGRGAVDGDDVVGVVVVDAEHGADDLRLVAVALGEARAERPVDQAAGEHGVVGGPALPAEERAGDLARGVRLLLDVHGQGEEVDPLPDAAVAVGGHEHLGGADAGHDGALGLLGELAGLEGQGLVGPAHGSGCGGGVSHGLPLVSCSKGAVPAPRRGPPDVPARRPDRGAIVEQLTDPPRALRGVVAATVVGRAGVLRTAHRAATWLPGRWC
jgi:hypothetical protein